jgi:hypothetical protein
VAVDRERLAAAEEDRDRAESARAVRLWCVCGVSVVRLWCVCGVSVVCLWCVCGVSVCLRCVCVCVGERAGGAWLSDASMLLSRCTQV